MAERIRPVNHSDVLNDRRAAFDQAIDSIGEPGPQFHVWLRPGHVPHHGDTADDCPVIRFHGPGTGVSSLLYGSLDTAHGLLWPTPNRDQRSSGELVTAVCQTDAAPRGSRVTKITARGRLGCQGLTRRRRASMAPCARPSQRR